MATKDVELRIRARDQASKQLNDIQKAIDLFTSTQREAGEASQKTGGLLAAFGQEIGKVASDLSKLQGVKGFVTDLDKVDSALGSVSAELTEARAASEQYDTSLKKITKDLGTYESQLRQIDTALDKQQKSNLELANSYSVVRDQSRKAATEANKLQRALEAARPKVRPSEAKVSAFQTRAGSLDRAKSVLNEQLIQGEAAAKALKQQQRELGAEVKRLQADQERFAKSATRANESITKQVTAVVALKNEKRQLQSEISKTNAALRTEISSISQVEEAQRRAIETGNRLRQAIATAPRSGAQQAAPTDSGARLTELKKRYEEVSQAAAGLARNIALTRKPTEQQTQDLKRSAAELARLRLEILQIRTQPFRDLGNAISQTEQQIRSNNAEIQKLGPAIRGGGLAASEAKTRILELVSENQRLTQTLSQQKSQYDALRPSVRQTINELKNTDVTVRRTANALNVARQGFISLAASIRPTSVSLRSFTGAATGAVAALLQLGSSTAPLGTVFRSLRGSVTATAASFLSFFAIFRQAQEVVKSFQLLEAAQNRLQVVFNGDQTATSKELRVLQAESKRLGVEFGVLADEYSKFAVAATQSNITLGTTRDLFIAVTEAGRVNKLSNEQLGGTFLALTQIISKGKFQAEEITRQLGDRLPGAISLFAKALTDGDIPKFFDELQKGNLRPTEENLKRLAATFKDVFGGQLEDSLTSTTTQLSRFEGLITIARQRIGQAGFIDAFTASLRDLNQFLDSRRGEEFFRSIGEGLTSIIGVARFLVENIDLLASAFRAFLAVKAISFFAGIVASIKTATAAFAANTAAVTLAQTQFKALAASATTSLIPALAQVGRSIRSLNFSTFLSSAGAAVGVMRTGLIPTLALLSKGLINLGRGFLAALGPIGLLIGAFEIIGGLAFDVSIFDVFGGLSGGLDDATKSALDTSFALQRIADAAVNSGGDVSKFQEQIQENISFAEANQQLDMYRSKVEEGERALFDFTEEQIRYSTSLGSFQAGAIGIVDAFRRKEISYKKAKSELNNLLTEQVKNRNLTKEQANAAVEAVVAFDGFAKQLEGDRAGLTEFNDLVTTLTGSIEEAGDALNRLRNREDQRQIDALPGLNSKEIQEEINELQKEFQGELIKTEQLQLQLARVEDLKKMALDEQGNVLSEQEGTYRTLLALAEAITSAIQNQSAAVRTIQSQTETLQDLEVEKNTLLIKNNKQRAIELATQLALNKAARDGITDIEELQSIRDNAARIAGTQFDIREANRPARKSAAPKKTEAENQAEKQAKFDRDQIQAAKERAAELQIIQIDDARARAVAEAAQQALNAAERQGVNISKEQLAIIQRQAAAKFDLLNPQREFEASQKRVRQLQRVLDTNERRIQTLRQRGDSGSLAAAEKLEEAQEKVRAVLRANITKAIELAKRTIKDPLELEAEIGSLQGQLEALEVVIGGIAGESINQIFTQNAVSGFDTFFEKLKEGEGVLQSLAAAFRSFVTNVLQQIAQLILNQAFTGLFGGITAGGGLNAGGGISGGIAGFLTSLFHDGGAVGTPASPGGSSTRSVSPLTFLGAKRYHSGGLPGLKNDEVPAILQTGEEVLSRADPRNVLNGGGQSAMQNIKVVNTIDSGSFISEGLNTPAGQKAIVNYIRANKATVRNVLGV